MCIRDSYLVAAGEEHRRNRLQALSLYPILHRRLLDGDFADIRKVIDDGIPLVDALAGRYVVPRAVIRAVAGTAPLAAGASVDRLEIVLPLLRDIPPTWWPRALDDWTRFTEAAQRIAALSRQPIMTMSNRLILRDCAQRGYRLPDFDTDEWQRTGQEIDDFFRGLHGALRFRLRESRPNHESELFAIRVKNNMFSSLGIVRIGRLAVRWGAAYRRTQAVFSSESELWRGARWLSLADSPLAVGDLVAHPLLTAKALAEEGVAMTNCAGVGITQQLPKWTTEGLVRMSEQSRAFPGVLRSNLSEKDGLFYSDIPMFIVRMNMDRPLSVREFLLRASRSLSKGRLRPPNYPKTLKELSGTGIPFWIQDCIVECVADKWDEREFLKVLWQELELAARRREWPISAWRYLVVDIQDRFARHNIPRLALRRALSTTTAESWPNSIRI